MQARTREKSFTANLNEVDRVGDKYLVDGKYSFKEIVDIEQLRKMLAFFSETTGFSTDLISYPKHELLINTGWREICTNFHRAFPDSKIYCKKSDLALMADVNKQMETAINHCENGMVGGATPIIIRGTHVANLFTGQVLFEKPDIAYFKKQGEAYGYDVDAYIQALQNVPIIKKEMLKKTLGFLREMITTLAEEGLTNILHEAALQLAEKSEKRYRDLFDTVPVGIYRSTPEGKFLDGNPALLKILGYPSVEVMLAASINDLYLDKNFREEELSIIEKDNWIANHIMQLRRYDGEIIWVQDNANVIRDSSGKALYYYGRLEDITEQLRTENNLRESEERYRTLIEQSNDAIYLLYEKHFEMINPKFSEIFGITSEQACSPDFDVMTLVAPESHTYFKERTQKIAQGMALSPHYEFTALDKDGIKVEMSVSTSYISYQDGIATQGILRDITKRKKSDEVLRKSEKKFRDLFEKSDDAILIIENGKFADCNKATIRMLRYKNRDEFLNLPPSALSPEKQSDGKDSLKKSDEMMQIALHKGSHRFIWEHLRADGEVFPVEVSLTAITTNNDDKRQIIHTIWRDITERVEAEKKLHQANGQLHKQLAEIKELETALREQAIRDPLTGLFNRRYMEEAFKQELAKASWQKTPLSVVILDLDDLKGINDTYGHLMGGDIALQTLADLLLSMCRAEDIICRYGGDEFLVILYETTIQVAGKRALQWKESLAKKTLEAKGKKYKITFSAGVAAFPINGLTSEEILIQADDALYQAKGLGRNYVMVSQQGS